MASEPKEEKDYGALFIPGGLLLGLGVALLIDPGLVPGGLLAGLGAGFIAWAIVRVAKK